MNVLGFMDGGLLRFGSPTVSFRCALMVSNHCEPLGCNQGIGLRSAVAKIVVVQSWSLFWVAVRVSSSVMSVNHLTRLETRTKESNMCASYWSA